MVDVGLVFAGGGGKGAYQIGAWKFLREYGLDQYITAVSGTSVGALNATMFAIGDFYAAESIWLNITREQILTTHKISLEDIYKWQKKIIIRQILPTPSKVLMDFQHENTHGIFSRNGLEEIIDCLPIEQISNRDIPCFATCIRLPRVPIPHYKIMRFDLRRQESPDTIKKILLASSAIPVIFEPVELEKHLFCCDGGLPRIGDNVPVQPIYDLGIRNIIVVGLNPNTKIDIAKFPNANIIQIFPENDLGGFTHGTLDFTSEDAKKRIEMGYHDAQKRIYALGIKWRNTQA